MKVVSQAQVIFAPRLIERMGLPVVNAVVMAVAARNVYVGRVSIGPAKPSVGIEWMPHLIAISELPHVAVLLV